MTVNCFWYDNQLIEGNVLKLTIDDPALLYGATVFTTLRVYRQSLDSPLTNWKQHCDRLHSGLQQFNWSPPNWQQVRRGAEALMAFSPVLRITIFPDGRELIIGRSLPEDLATWQQNGIRAWVADAPHFRRSLATYKTGNYLSAWLAKQRAKEFGSLEAILIDDRGNWLETSTGNLWGWRDGQWWTPPVAAGILPGLARSQLLTWLSDRRRIVKQENWSAEWVKDLEAIAHTNSVVELVPIHSIFNNNIEFLYDPLHPALQELRGLWQRDRN